MGVLTEFYRLKADAMKTLEANPELMDWLLGCSEITANGEKLGFNNGTAPPHLNIDKAWDEILIILCGADNEDACHALDIPLWEEFDGFEEVRLFLPAQVKNGFEILEKLEIEHLRTEALRRELRTYDGEPIGYLLNYALNHLESLRNFWRAAAEAGEGIVSSMG